MPTDARHSQRSGTDQVRDFALVTNADCGWFCSHAVRKCGRPCVWLGRQFLWPARCWGQREQSGANAGDWIAEDQDSRAALVAVHEAEALVQDMRQALAQAEQQRHSRSHAAMVRSMRQSLEQAEQQLTQAQAQPQQTIPAQQERCQLVRELQAMQRACWNRSLSAELSGLILGKTSRYNVRMVAVSCPLLRDTANAAEPIKFETSPWSRARFAAGNNHTLCVNAGGRVFAWGENELGQLGVGDKENRVVPTLVTGLLKTKTVVQVTAGWEHTACLTADGLVFVCGYGTHDRLGVGDTEDRVVQRWCEESWRAEKCCKSLRVATIPCV